MKKKINYFILGSGVLTVIFAIFFDIIFKNPFFFGPSQLILLFFGLSLIFLFFSKKIFLVQLSFTIGILFVLINSNYFSITTKSPIVKEASTKINENITDDEINELKRFLYKSENFIDQTQFVKYFANIEKNQKINNFIDIENLDVKNKLPILKEKIVKNYLNKNKEILLADLNIKILETINRKKFDILIVEFDALPKIRAIANVYVPKNKSKKYPTIFSVPGCGEHLWTDYPRLTDPQHRLGLIASNEMVGITSISMCSNSDFTKNHRFEIYKHVTREKILDQDLAILIWMRLINLYNYFDFIDENKLGITGYSNGASVIEKILYIDNKIKTVVLVGTNIRDIYNNSSYLNFAQQRISESENRNYYFGAGPNLLNESVYSFMNLEKMNQNLWMSLLQFDFRKNFFFLFGKKDDAINLGVRKNSKKNINLLNKINEKIVGFKNIEFLENDEDHNFAKNNNLIAIKYFNKKFYGTETLDENVNYKKNNKEELLPIKYKFDLKKYYLDSFLKKLDDVKNGFQNQEIDQIISENLRLNILTYDNLPILLLNQNLKINKENINSSFYSLNLFEELEAYFYEFVNEKMKSTNKINIIVTSNKANPKELKTIIANGFKTYLIIMPGYGISQPRFTTIGSVAKKLWEDTSNPILAGLSVKSIKLLNNFVFKSKNKKKFDVEYYAYDFEANAAIILFKLRYKNFDKLISKNYSNKLDEFISYDSDVTLPAFFFIENFHKVFLLLNNLDYKKYNVNLNSETDYSNFIFNN